MKVVIGTRGSELAKVQANIAAQALTAVDQTLKIEMRIIETKGDTNQAPIPLDANGKGWFTKEIEDALLKKDIDIAVHSLKDVGDDIPDGLVLGAYISREDARDCLITRTGSLDALHAGAVVGTDSIRRKIQLLALHPVEVRSIRGNVPTRLAKLDAGEYDALVLAVAGLKRLGLEKRITHYFTQVEMTSAPGQGILALQIRSEDTRLAELLARVNDEHTARAARIERAFSHTLGGGCKSPIGAYASHEGEVIMLVGMMQGVDGTLIRDQMSSPVIASDALGEQLAEHLRTLHGTHA